MQFFVVKRWEGRGGIKYKKAYKEPDFDTGDIPTVIRGTKAGLFIEQLSQHSSKYRHRALK